MAATGWWGLTLLNMLNHIHFPLSKISSDRCCHACLCGVPVAAAQVGAPGNWDHIINQIGMFSFTGLNKVCHVGFNKCNYLNESIFIDNS